MCVFSLPPPQFKSASQLTFHKSPRRAISTSFPLPPPSFAPLFSPRVSTQERTPPQRRTGKLAGIWQKESTPHPPKCLVDTARFCRILLAAAAAAFSNHRWHASALTSHRQEENPTRTRKCPYQEQTSRRPESNSVRRRRLLSVTCARSDWEGKGGSGPAPADRPVIVAPSHPHPLGEIHAGWWSGRRAYRFPLQSQNCRLHSALTGSSSVEGSERGRQGFDVGDASTSPSRRRNRSSSLVFAAASPLRGGGGGGFGNERGDRRDLQERGFFGRSPSRQKQVPEPFSFYCEWRCPAWEGRQDLLVAGGGSWLGNRRDL